DRPDRNRTLAENGPVAEEITPVAAPAAHIATPIARAGGARAADDLHHIAGKVLDLHRGEHRLAGDEVDRRAALPVPVATIAIDARPVRAANTAVRLPPEGIGLVDEKDVDDLVGIGDAAVGTAMRIALHRIEAGADLGAPADPDEATGAGRAKATRDS